MKYVDARSIVIAFDPKKYSVSNEAVFLFSDAIESAKTLMLKTRKEKASNILFTD